MVDRLQTAGFQAYLAGGCVRDLLIGRMPNDFDIATDAKPDEIESLFDRSVAVGKAFGVITVPFSGYQIEISTFRKDGDYTDGRRPDSVDFCDAEEDAKRRDFTINAMFYDPVAGKVIDFVGGQTDLSKKLIRCVGEPDLRFKEDQLRLLRAVRFSSQIGFEIDLETWRAVVRNPVKLRTVSSERCTSELIKILQSLFVAEGLQKLQDSGLWAELIVEPDLSASDKFSFSTQTSRWVRSKRIISRFRSDSDDSHHCLIFSLGVLLMQLSPVKKSDYSEYRDDDLVEALSSDIRQQIDEFFANLRFSRKIIQAISRMILSARVLQMSCWSCRTSRINQAQRVEQTQPIRFGCLAKTVVNEQFPLAIKYLQLSQNLSSENETEQSTKQEPHQGCGQSNEQDRKKNTKNDIKSIIERLNRFSGELPKPWLEGKTLIDLKIKKGPEMGQLLREGFYRQLEGLDENRELQLEWLKDQRPQN